jgi:MoaA/NifB/PqqE/SkfB family radical SAM enzyme
MALKRVSFHLTDRCQLNCDHCLRDPQHKPQDLEPELIISVLDQARALFGTDHVGLTGGEPTLHPRFYDIIDAIVDRGYRWHMVSNGERFDRIARRLAERAARLEGLVLMNFSLDGATEPTHDAIREQGSFRTVLRATSVCHARNIPFLLQMTVNARNVHEIEAFALLASELGAAKISYNFTMPTGTFLDASLYLPASEWHRALDRIHRVQASFKCEVSYSENGPQEAPFHVCEMWRHAHLHVDIAGRLNLCCHHSNVPGQSEVSDVAGDLRHMTLAEAHARFTDLVHDTMRARLATIARPDMDEWDRHFSCNWCLKRFGKPHWVEGGTAGGVAERPRWRGLWAPGYKESHVSAERLVRRARTPDAAE